MNVFDLAVIGGGPAGASAAITAAQLGFKVLLLEAGRFPRHKVCGGFISNEALAVLELLGCSSVLARAPQISRARIFVDDRLAEFCVAPAAVSLTRHALDLELWKTAQRAGVLTQEQARVQEARRNKQLFTIRLDGEQFEARGVINASGRWSNIGIQKPLHGNHWIGIEGQFIEANPASSCDLYFFEGGYCGVQPISADTVNVATMVRADVARSLPAVFQRNRNLAQRSQRWKPATVAVSTAPLLFRTPETSRDGMLLAGDAAAFIDPFAGDGISMALHSGRLATLALATYLRGEDSFEDALRNYDIAHRDLIQRPLKDAARLRFLTQLPRSLRLAAMTLLQFPPLARSAFERTRLRKVG